MSRRWSLRWRLVALFTLSAALAWVAGAIWLAHRARAEAEQMFDASLIETAHVVLALAAHELGEDDEFEGGSLELSQSWHEHAERLFYQVRSPRGGILLYSVGAPAAPLADAGERGLADHVIDGVAWRIFSLRDPITGFVLHIGEPAARRDELARAALWRLALPGALLVPLLGVAGWLVSGRAVRPIERAAQRVDATGPGEDIAFATGELPREIEPLARALARLQDRVRQTLLLERTLTADAAHELRTPLAALRAQAQWAERATDERERRAALQATVTAADRCARLADSVLTLARLDAAAFETSQAPLVGLHEIVALVARDAAPAAAARGVRLTIACPALALHADADALAILLRNLVDNALRHARHEARIEVARDAGILIAVRDDGEGAPRELRARLFDRFFRAPGGDAEGSGLGLALVRRVAELHGGSVTAHAGVDGRGLGIEVRLPDALAG